MKLNLFVCLMCGLLCVELNAQGQQEKATNIAQSMERVPAYQPRLINSQNGLSRTVWRYNQENNELQTAYAELRAAETEDRNAAIEKLRGALSEQYDNSLDNYEKYLEQMEEKIQEMKKQLDKRRGAKMDLVDLRLKTLVNEADGMAWPSASPGGFFNQNGFGNFGGSNFAFPNTGSSPPLFSGPAMHPSAPVNPRLPTRSRTK